MSVSLNVETRDTSTRAELRQLREQGKVPGVVYGKAIEGSASIAIEERDLILLLRGNANAIIDLSIEGTQETHPVMIHEVQRDKVLGNLLHIDFHEINMTEPVRAKVWVEVNGEAAGVKDEGGILQVQLTEIEVRCLPSELPRSISVDVSGLAAGDSIVTGDLSLPSGVELLTDPDELVVTVLVPQKVVEDEEERAEAVQEAEAGEEMPVNE